MSCIFCDIVAHRVTASLIHEDEHTVAFLDQRQFHPGHVLIVPRLHVSDIREASDEIMAGVIHSVTRVSRAVHRAFPSDGLSIWHSAGEGANQEVPHLHFHVHPRFFNDDVLRVYPSQPSLPERGKLDQMAKELRLALEPGQSHWGRRAGDHRADEF